MTRDHLILLSFVLLVVYSWTIYFHSKSKVYAELCYHEITVSSFVWLALEITVNSFVWLALEITVNSFVWLALEITVSSFVWLALAITVSSFVWLALEITASSFVWLAFLSILLRLLITLLISSNVSFYAVHGKSLTCAIYWFRFYQNN